MFSSNVHRRLCIHEGKGFSQRIILNKENDSVQQTKPNIKTNEKEDPRTSKPCGTPFLWEAFLVNGTSFPCDTQLPFGMLFITMFYTCLVVYHTGGGGRQRRIRKIKKKKKSI